MVTTRQKSAGTNGGGDIPRVPLFRVTSADSFDSPIDRRSALYRQRARQLVTHKLPSPRPVPKSILTLPTILTLFRVLCVPLLVAFWFLDHMHAPVATAAIFIVASATDWLDGYLARRMKLTTAFGSFLDPVADKIMVSTVLVLLASEPPPPITRVAMAAPVATMIAREIAMSALREWAASSGGAAHRAVKVSVLGKWKTALQMIAMSLLLVLRNDHLVGDSAIVYLHQASVACYGLLVVAAALATFSLARYFHCVWEFFLQAQPEGAKEH
jgi:CDP-diacylglycerol---glycerol-3-phosphate 3-phosphatidyltransferase